MFKAVRLLTSGLTLLQALHPEAQREPQQLLQQPLLQGEVLEYAYYKSTTVSFLVVSRLRLSRR